MAVQITGTEGADTITQGLRTELTVIALGGNDRINLNRTDDLGGDNTVDAGTGNDTVVNLFEGGNQIVLGTGNDVYTGSGFAFGFSTFDIVQGGVGNDTIAVTTLQSRYFGEADNDTFFSEGHRNFFDGGAGTDLLSYALRDESSTLRNRGVSLDLEQGFALTGNSVVEDFASIESAAGTNVADQLLGSSVNNVLSGRGGNDVMAGRDGNDRLDGGTGADDMRGGRGNDTYIVDNAGDIVDEFNEAGAGIDTVISSISFSLVASARVGGVVENLTLAGASSISARGNAANNILTGNAGANTLNGDTGADRMIGGAGNDTYAVDNSGDIIDERSNGGAGIDTVRSLLSISLTESARVVGTFENLVLLGNAANGTGNAAANTLTGTALANILNGAAGADRMIGGAGNDTYAVDNAGDIVDERSNGGAGSDTVRTAISYSIVENARLLGSIENLTLTGGLDINARGNAANNIITGNRGSNVLNGDSGADRMIGGAGNDTYAVDNLGDIIDDRSNGGAGIDTVRASISLSLTESARVIGTFEHLTLVGGGAINATGNASANILTGNASANALAGGLGNDTLTGGAGADSFVFNTLANATTNRDTITDFSVVDDTIRIDNAVFTTLVGTGTLSAGQFTANANGIALDAGDRIIYETDTGRIFFDANGSAAGGSVHFATVSADLAITSADFFII